MLSATRWLVLAALVTASAAEATPSLIDSLAPAAHAGPPAPLWRALRSPVDALARAHFEAELARVDADPQGAQAPAPIDDKPEAVSLGSPAGGWLVYPARLQASSRLRVRERSNFGTDEMVQAIAAGAAAAENAFPGGHALVVGDLSRKSGGPFRPHRSHQSGRDADIGYYQLAGTPEKLVRTTARTLDRARTWTLIASLVANDKVEMIFMDRGLERALYTYAKQVAKVPDAVLARVFSYPGRGKTGVVRYLRGHSDHFHVRFAAPQAIAAAGDYIREHGVAAVRPLPVYRAVKRGETLTSIARRHHTSIKQLCAWNRIKARATLHPGQKLVVGFARPRLPAPRT